MEHLESNPQITVNGFKHAGIHQSLGLLEDYSFDKKSYDEFDSCNNEYRCDEDENNPLRVSDVYSDTESDGEFPQTDFSDTEVFII